MRISVAQIILVCLIFSPGLFAQDFHRISLYGGVHRAEALGEYRQYLDRNESSPARFGIYGGILFNPMPGKEYNSPVNIGLELGGNGWGTEPAADFLNSGLSQKYRSFYTNFLVRYRPLTGPVKVSPFLDVSAGPYWAGSVVQVLISQDEYRQLFKYSRVSKTFSIGAGAGLLKRSRNGSNQFIDLGIYYRYVEKLASVRRGTLYFDQNDNAEYAVQYIKPDIWNLKLSFTGFL